MSPVDETLALNDNISVENDAASPNILKSRDCRQDGNSIEMSLQIASELEEAVRYALTHKGDPVVLQQIQDASARIREEYRRENGVTNVAAELIREVRDE